MCILVFNSPFKPDFNSLGDRGSERSSNSPRATCRVRPVSPAPQTPPTPGLQAFTDPRETREWAGRTRSRDSLPSGKTEGGGTQSPFAETKRGRVAPGGGLVAGDGEPRGRGGGSWGQAWAPKHGPAKVTAGRTRAAATPCPRGLGSLWEGAGWEVGPACARRDTHSRSGAWRGPAACRRGEATRTAPSCRAGLRLPLASLS